MGKKAMKQLNEAVDYLKKKYKHQPEVGIVLGSGLGTLLKKLKSKKKLITAIYQISRYQL
jgi:purine nucleoside phosphorylase